MTSKRKQYLKIQRSQNKNKIMNEETPKVDIEVEDEEIDPDKEAKENIEGAEEPKEPEELTPDGL